MRAIFQVKFDEGLECHIGSARYLLLIFLFECHGLSLGLKASLGLIASYAKVVHIAYFLVLSCLTLIVVPPSLWYNKGIANSPIVGVLW